MILYIFGIGMNLKHKVNDAMPYWGEKRGHFAQIVYVFCVRGGGEAERRGMFSFVCGHWSLANFLIFSFSFKPHTCHFFLHRDILHTNLEQKRHKFR